MRQTEQTQNAKTAADAKANRAKLLNIAAGGDGQILRYIERVTYDDAPAGAEPYGYIVHLPQGAEQGAATPAIHVRTQSIEAARGLLHAITTGAKPRNPEDKAEDVAAISDSIPVIDNGRHIPYGSK